MFSRYIADDGKSGLLWAHGVFAVCFVRLAVRVCGIKLSPAVSPVTPGWSPEIG